MANLDHVSRWRERALATEAEQAVADARAAEIRSGEEALAALQKQAEAGLAPRWRREFSAYLLAGEQAARAALFVEAEDFSRSNLRADSEHWGNAGCTIVHSPDGGEQYAEWDLTLPAGGAWQLEARYASDESRPLAVRIDGELVAEAVLGRDTASFFPDGQSWEVVGAFRFPPGRSVLRIEREGPVPHLDKIALVPLAADEDVSDWPAAIAGELGLVPQIVRNVADVLVRGARTNEPILALWRAFAELPAERFAEASRARFEELRAARERGELTIASPLTALLDGLAPASLQEWAARYQTIVSLVEDEWAASLAAGPAGAPPTALSDAGKEALRSFLHGPQSPFALPAAVLETLYPAELRASVVERRAALGALRASAPPPFAQVLCVEDEAAPVDVPVHVRGSHLTLAEEATPRGVLSVCSEILHAPSMPSGESGRLELARWLVDPEHPLVARVMANRIWLGHFGEGIVRSPSNFGLRGESPTHPELLDWLAREFIRGGWSIKALHRTILASSTYRMSTRYDAAGAALDPENRLLWRMNRRRLEAECVRDALLAASGTLDPTLGGSLLPTQNGDYVTNDQSKDLASYGLPRRSIYMPIIRNAMFDFFATFDYADPSVPIEQRPRTTVASQALYLMNGPLVMEASASLADRVLGQSSGDRDGLERAWLACLARAPSPTEVERALGWLESERARAGSASSVAAPDAGAGPRIAADPTAERAHWQHLVQVLFATNEFLYVD